MFSRAIVVFKLNCFNTNVTSSQVICSTQTSRKPSSLRDVCHNPGSCLVSLHDKGGLWCLLQHGRLSVCAGLVCVCVCRVANPPTDLSVASRPSISSKLKSVRRNRTNKKYADTHDQKLFCAHPNCAWKLDNQKPPVPLSLRDRLLPICLLFSQHSLFGPTLSCTFSNTAVCSQS